MSKKKKKNVIANKYGVAFHLTQISSQLAQLYG